jgi:protein BCP1
VDVDFEFFDPIADIDWHGIKRLLTQLLQADAPLFHPNPLADLILSQPLVGSTVKCDGRESDPYAFLSVINLNVHAVRFFPKWKVGPIDRVS